MMRQIAGAVLALSAAGIVAQSLAPRPKFDAFEVATIKPVDSDAKASRFITMQGTHRFIEKDYTLKLLIAAAYSLSPRTISGGPAWIESEHYDILAVTPGEVRPTHDEQMSMLRKLLADRFRLTFHREQKEFLIYVLEVAKNGPKLKASASPPGDPAALISTVYPQRILLPARNTTMGEFAALMQRAMLDRPVVDKTGLSGKYDFDLEWVPDETQFGGDIPTASPDAPAAPLFEAIQQQLGLRLEATRGPVEALVVDKAAFLGLINYSDRTRTDAWIVRLTCPATRYFPDLFSGSGRGRMRQGTGFVMRLKHLNRLLVAHSGCYR